MNNFKFGIKKIDKKIQLKVHFKIKNTEYQNVLLKTKLPRYEVKISLSFKHLNENIGLIKTQIKFKNILKCYISLVYTTNLFKHF